MFLLCMYVCMCGRCILYTALCFRVCPRFANPHLPAGCRYLKHNYAFRTKTEATVSLVFSVFSSSLLVCVTSKGTLFLDAQYINILFYNFSLKFSLKTSKCFRFFFQDHILPLFCPILFLDDIYLPRQWGNKSQYTPTPPALNHTCTKKYNYN